MAMYSIQLVFTKVVLVEIWGRGEGNLNPDKPDYCEVWNYVIICVRHSAALLYKVLTFR